VATFYNWYYQLCKREISFFDYFFQKNIAIGQKEPYSGVKTELLAEKSLFEEFDQ